MKGFFTNRPNILIFNLFALLSVISSMNGLFFDVYSTKEVCFMEEFVEDSVAIIQYKTFETYINVPETDKGFFSFDIHSVQSERMNTVTLLGKQVEGKVYFVVPEANFYMICVKGNPKSFLFRKTTTIKIGINIDPNDKIVNFSHDELPKNKHFKELDDKVKSINNKANYFMKMQSLNTDLEETFSEFQTQNSKTLLFMTVFEVIVIIGTFFFTYVRLRKAMRTEIN
eukprot:CAMPEP_0170520388 /NCGR_PEP_ID=MMETSP0209-20121228/5693_1 /TAXON_ID=665100 ORGANISM="Litonotus pictus, Strain P1" /NCGR_SAMPLE_ID=MMETSP0209 /ASSEMBLY_ACC=CAM_ASM_000301 /LENGTH=226 /DNA_ID=CAMNT_0010806661 /DNA_START=1 /DNA_END=681 /DNA_ORIENTATION=-